MSSLPSEFVGVWERVELVVEGRIIDDAGRSFWFQAGSRFLDVRAAGGGLPSEAFAGVTSWDPSTQRLSWSHELDMHPDARDDSGRVEWVDGDLVEHGTADQFGELIHYSEVWRRRSEAGDPVVIANRVDGIGGLAWCADRGAVTIDNRPTGAFLGGVFTVRSWGCVFDIVHGRPLAREGAVLPAPAEGTSFDRWGHQWRVVDIGP